MEEINKIHLRINQLKTEIKPQIFYGIQRKYLTKFILANRKPITRFLILALVESLLLISLPIILKFLVENDYNFFRLHSLLLDVTLLSVLVLAYIVTSYLLIRLDQTISFNLINQIKMHWLGRFYGTASSRTSVLSDGSLITKFVYHTQLLKMALEKVVMEGTRAIIFYLVILASAFLFSSSTFLWLLLGFPFLCLVFFIFYRIGSYYISREQTLNTRLIKAIVQQTSNLQQTQSLGLVRPRFKMIEGLLEQDTFFRKRREIWVKFSDRLVFALILLSGGFLYVLKDFYPIFSWDSWTESAIGLILAGFFTKVVIQVTHAGLFGQALKTGLIISIPDFAVGKNPGDSSVDLDFNQKILVYGRKVRLSKFAGVIVNFELELLPGSKTLIRSEGPLGKSTLARYLGGLKQVDSLNVKNGRRRILSVKWGSSCRSRQYLSLSRIYRETIAEFLLAKPSEEINQEDLQKVFQVLGRHPEFEFIFKFNDFLGKRFNSSESSETELILLQIAQAVLNKPRLICVDHDIFDHQNERVSRGLEILEQECSGSTLVFFSGLTGQPDTGRFENTYTLSKNAFQKN